jgi:hypothetical protein
MVRSPSKPPPLPSPGVPGAGEKPATTYLTLNSGLACEALTALRVTAQPSAPRKRGR